MLKLAVTGGIACGKSLVGKFMAEAGVPVCDADDLARLALDPGRPAFAAAVAAFGRGIVAPDGTIDRRRLGDLVFSRPAERERLNAIVHPVVRDLLDDWVRAHASASRLVAGIVPLLYEVGWQQGWDAVVCVACHPGVQRERLAHRGLSAAEAELRVASQMPLDEKMKRADYVIVNNGSGESAREQARRVLQHIAENETWA